MVRTAGCGRTTPPRRRRVALWMMAAGLASACAEPRPVAGPPPRTTRSVADGVTDTFVSEHSAQRVAWPSDPDAVLRTWTGARCVVLTADDRAQDGGAALDAATRRACEEYVIQGGRLLLFGFAARFVHALGVEPVLPDRLGFASWGDDDRTAVGLMQFGLAVATGAPAMLTADLRAFPRRPDAFLFGGGSGGVIAQRCTWSARPPANGEVVGRTAWLRDLDFAIESDDAALVRWRHGAGHIVACGWVPEPGRPEPAIAANARIVLRNLLAWTCDPAAPSRPDDRTGAVVVCTIPSSRVANRSGVAERAEDGALPGAIEVPHTGWRVAISEGREPGAEIAPRSVYDDVIQPSFRAGASLLELAIVDPVAGYPFAWPRDAAARPARLRGGERSLWPGWSPGQVAILAREAHHRGLLLQLDLAGATTQGSEAIDQQAIEAVRAFAAEFADVRRLGDAAVDGIGLGSAARDPVGVLAAALTSYAPAAYGHTLRPRTAPVAGFSGVLHSGRGRPAGLPTAGLSDAWRTLFPPETFPLGVLDAHESMGAGSWASGGSYPDWLVTQLADFVRPRRGRGAALWWNGFDANTLGADTRDYVHGLTVDPTRAAAAFRLSATGRDGMRAACRALLPRVQRGFGAESPLPAATTVLQNASFRLHGTGGPLWFDRTGTANFRAGASGLVAVAPRAFLATSVRGARPRIGPLDSAAIDFVGAAPRGEGGYDTDAVVDLRDVAGSTTGFPARLARGRAPLWPAAVELRCTAAPGRYRLDLDLRPRSGSGVLALRVEGAVHTFIPFDAAGLPDGVDRGRQSLELDLVGALGPRSFDLELVFGDGVLAFVECSLRRVEGTASVGCVGAARAGHRAELVERTSSLYFEEEVRAVALADFPGFVLHTHCDLAVRNLQVVRRFDLPGHRRLRLSAEPADALTSTFILESTRDDAPDLAVVLLDPPFGTRCTFSPQAGLELVSFPRAGQECRLGVALLDRTSPLRDQPRALRSIFAAMIAPPLLQLADPHRAAAAILEVTPALELPGSTFAPRWLRIRSHDPVAGMPGPFMVREGGAWRFRGAQPDLDPGTVWLRVYESRQHRAAITPWNPAELPVRPGPGSLHTIALREVPVAGDGAVPDTAPFEQSVDVEVVQTGPLIAAPSIVFAAPFDQVRVDGEPWWYVDGPRVLLPHRLGRYRVTTRRLERAAEPRLRACRAIVTRCAFDPTMNVLEIVTVRRPEDPVDTAYVAWIDAPTEPVDVTGGGVRLAESAFLAADEAATTRRGFMIRVRPGLVRLRF